MDMYLHVRVLFSLILGLGVSRLLAGVARIVQHPRQYKVYWVHLLWALFLFLYLIHFWWWEYRSQTVPRWTFPLYLFIALRRPAFSFMRPSFSRRNGGLRQLQSLLLFSTPLDFQLNDGAIHR